MHRKTLEEFSFGSFEHVLDVIQSFDYVFSVFGEPVSRTCDRQVYLRHDVDLSPDRASKFGKIEFAREIRASYFFQIGAGTYDIFATHTRDIIALLKGMNHCVGLHIDERLITADDESVGETIQWFRKRVIEVDQICSFHRPTEDVLGKDFASFTNAYAPAYFSTARYVSDSRRNGGFLNNLQDLLCSKASPIQLLLHPGWWGTERDARAIATRLIECRTEEVAEYLGSNFGAVFGGVFDDEDSTAGLQGDIPGSSSGTSC